MRVSIHKSLISNEYPHDLTVFMIHLPTDFPFHAPWIHCETKFLEHSICDGWDLFRPINRGEWMPSNTIKDIILKIPTFILWALKEQSVLPRRLIGQFHLHSYYNIDGYLGVADTYGIKDVDSIFVDRIRSPSDSGDRLLILTETALLVFEDVNLGNTMILRGW